MSRGILGMAALLVGLLGASAQAKDMQVLAFSFEVPDHWVFQGSGQGKAMASGGTAGAKFPVLVASGCVPSLQTQCTEPSMSRSAVIPQCGQVTAQEMTRENGLREVRWVCPSPVTSGPVTAQTGISLFSIDGAFLTFWYVGDAKDEAPTSVLDSVGRSMKFTQ